MTDRFLMLRMAAWEEQQLQYATKFPQGREEKQRFYRQVT